jgi:hypothetical protein
MKDADLPRLGLAAFMQQRARARVPPRAAKDQQRERCD